VRLFVVTGDCGDYYCEALHLIAVCSSLWRAEEIKRGCDQREITKYKGDPLAWWSDTEIDEVDLDAVIQP
jgi:hypothetical protein